jgi:phosphohistidine phosphatase
VKRVYFLRHGKAAARSEWQDDDGLRPLTPEGEKELRREAVALKRLGLAPDVIVTSPLVRARQTADIVAAGLGLEERVVEDERLARGFDARALGKVAAAHPSADQVMVVGHEPDFSATIGELTGGAVAMKKGGLARVDLAAGSPGSGELVWLLTPPLLGA